MYRRILINYVANIERRITFILGTLASPAALARPLADSRLYVGGYDYQIVGEVELQGCRC